MLKLKQIAATMLSLAVTTALYAEVEKKDLKIGFIALTDCAPIVIAKEKGFFEKHGLNVKVVITPPINKVHPKRLHTSPPHAEKS